MAGKDQVITNEQQRILGFRVQASAFGLPIPIIWGTRRIPGNLTWYGDFTAIAHESETSSGGGGKGGGEVKQRNITYTYTASLIIGLCEGPIAGVKNVWRGKEKFTGIGTAVATEAYSTGQSQVVAVAQAANFLANVEVRSSETTFVDGEGGGGFQTFEYTMVPGLDYTVNVLTGQYTFLRVGTYTVYVTYYYSTTLPSGLAQIGGSLFVGSYTQQAWSYLTTRHPSQALAYRGLAYGAFAAYDLGDNAALQNHNFEVQGPLQYSSDIVDADPSAVGSDFLINAHYGVGFPSTSIASWTQWSNYCVANGIFLSPAILGQRQASDFLLHLAKLTNTAPVYSEGLLKMVPYSDEAATGNGATYTPSVTPLYSLDDDDFLYDDGEDPVRVERNNTADAFNQLNVIFGNRANDYNDEPAEAKDQSNIEDLGLRPAEPVQAPEITTLSVARFVAQQLLQRMTYVREIYEFRLPWQFALLEPMDVLLITDDGLGLDEARVRIISIEEDEEGFLVRAEEFPTEVAQAALYDAQESEGFETDFNASPGNVNTPVFLEAPSQVTASGSFELWAAISGGEDWGGCDIWISIDDTSYKKIGTVHGPSRHGVLVNSIGIGTDPDTATGINVNLSVSGGTLLSGTQADADQGATACWIEGEVLSYQTAELTGTNQYTLKDYLRRGQFNTDRAAHGAGSRFVRLDNSLFRWPFTIDMVGQTVYFKFTSFNPVGGGVQNLVDVNAYQYTVTGVALQEPPADVDGFSTRFNENITELYWNRNVDWRTPIGYEVRFGPTYDNAKVIARTFDTTIQAVGNGTYWIAAYFELLNGVLVYSENPATLEIEGAVLTRNILATWDEVATGWSGTFNPDAVLTSPTIRLDGAGNFLDITDYLNNSDILWYGGLAASGAYQIPVGHRVDALRVAPCMVLLDITGYGESIFDNILIVEDWLTYQDILGAQYGAVVSIVPQIRIAGGDAIFGGWQNWAPGFYNARYFDARVLLTTSDPTVNAVVAGFSLTVDVPDRVERAENVVVGTGGITVVFDPAFNSNPPNTQITILNAQAGDDAILTNQTASGFDLVIKNGGVNVQRNINRFSQGY